MSSFDELLAGKPYKPRYIPAGVRERELDRIRNQKPTMPDFTRQAAGTSYVEEFSRDDATVYNVEREKSDMFDTDEVINFTEDANAHMDDETNVYRIYDFSPRPVISLPIDGSKEKILNSFNIHDICIIKGDTGCGKSTRVPQIILDDCKERGIRCKIVVTQPRKIAATSLAQRVCEERGWALGTLVGYQVGHDIAKVSPDTCITYCTTEVLLRKLVNTKRLTDYTHIFLDEVHERDQHMDFLLIVVKKLLSSSAPRKVKLALMSATIETDKFSDYFSKDVNKKSIEVATHKILGKRRFEIREFYLEDLRRYLCVPYIDIDSPGITDEGYKTTVELVKLLDGIDAKENDDKGEPIGLKGSVLVFLPGRREIEVLYNELIKHGPSCIKVFALHSSVTHEEQRLAISYKPQPGQRKIILSTNIAESSITVPDIKYVIDYCLTKQLVMDTDTNYPTLQITWASKNNCIQRAGRVGRVSDGRVYRLVPKTFYNDLPYQNVPEMLRAPLDKLVLYSKMLDMGEPRHIFALALDSPDLNEIGSTIKSLKEIGALSVEVKGKYHEFDGDLTFMGRVIGELPVDIHLGKLIFLGYVFGQLKEAIIIASAMTSRNLFSTPFFEYIQAYSSKLAWACSCRSDCLAYLFAYEVWCKKHADNDFCQKGESEYKWAKQKYVQIRALNEVDDVVCEIEKRLEYFGISVRSSKRIDPIERSLILKIMIAGAFYPNYFIRGASGGQINEREAVKILGGRDPYSTVYLQGIPRDQPIVLYTDQLKKYFKDVAESVEVSFDEGSSKVFLQFKSSVGMDHIPGKINSGVYKALKIREIKKFVEINAYPTDVAYQKYNEYLEDQKKSQIETGSSRQRLRIPWPWNRSSLGHSTYLEIIVSYVEKPVNRFWIQCYKLLHLVGEIDEQLNTPNRLVRVTPGQVELGKLYAGEYEDRSGLRYYRCKVMSLITPDSYKVHFVDYGNTEILHISQLQAFGPKLLSKEYDTIPELAIQCVLSHVSPSRVKNDQDKWCPEAEQFMKKLRNEHFYAKVYSFSNDIASVILYKSQPSENTRSINQHLIDVGYAVQTEEPFLSQLDHLDRDKAYEDTRSSTSCCSFPTMKFPQTDKVEPGEYRSKFRLQGPYSPLETKIFGITRTNAGKTIMIEQNSVNNILLDGNPQDSYDKMLVAGTVSAARSSGKLIIRDTTMMPNVPGFPALMCLLFAPAVELRTNRENTKFTGALCGLGTSCVKRPGGGEELITVYTENDIEIPFDSVFDMRSMASINKIRKMLNSAIVSNTGNKYANIVFKDQDLIRKSIKQLIVERECQSLYCYQNPHVWKLNHSSMDKCDIYKEIYVQHLNAEQPPDVRAIHANLQNISNMMLGTMALKKEGTKCLACDVQLDDMQCLRVHCASLKHQKKLAWLKAEFHLQL